MRNTNLSVTPGAIIGYRRNGTPIRLIAGGSEPTPPGDGGSQAGAGAGDGGQAGPSDGGSGTGSGGQDGGSGAGGGQTGTGSTGASQGDDDRAARTIAAVREDFKAERAKRQEAERRIAALEAAAQSQQAAEAERNKKLAIALGVATEEPPDPEKLAAELAAERQARQDELSARQARERELTVELALLKSAAKHGADPERLADSRSFMARLAALDPGSDSFADDLGAVIKAAVEANPGFKLAAAAAASSGTSNAAGTGDSGDGQASQSSQQGSQQGGQSGSRTTAPPARSGSDDGHNGAAGGSRQWTDEDVARASAKEVQAAQKAGLLVGLGIHPPKSRR